MSEPHKSRTPKTWSNSCTRRRKGSTTCQRAMTLCKPLPNS